MLLETLQPGSRPYLDLAFPAPPRDRPYVVVNMVASIDGKAVIEGTEQGLGSKEDKERMQELRAHVDAVMNGANTLRQSGASSRVRARELQEWRREHGKTEHPLGVIVTSKGDFETKGPYFERPGLESVILASAMTKKRKAEIEALGPEVYDLPKAGGLASGLRYLRRDKGVELLLCEGGATLNAQLLAIGAVDEWFQTLSPMLVGGRDRLTVLEGSRRPPVQVNPVSAITNPDNGEIYLRYRVV